MQLEKELAHPMQRSTSTAVTSRSMAGEPSSKESGDYCRIMNQHVKRRLPRKGGGGS